jgi:glycyl-tRNA synthetase beta chain
MVGEFPELQGVMGRYYALQSGETDTVAQAIGDHYLPAFSGDQLPSNGIGKVVSLADRLDTLTGIFAAGLKPTGNKDPFALRRAALGLIRILLDGELSIDLDKALSISAQAIQQQLQVSIISVNKVMTPA